MCPLRLVEQSMCIPTSQQHDDAVDLLKQQKRDAIRSYKQQSRNPEKDCMKRDLLALSTDYYRIVVESVTDAFLQWSNTPAVKILLRSSQPAHLVTLLAVFGIAAVVCPVKTSQDLCEVKPSVLLNLTYLSAFVIHFGAQMWMTFVSGLTLYFAVPRHTFGEVQKVLFPKYFCINAFLSLVTLTMFVRKHPSSTWDSQMFIQVSAMVFCFLIELLIRLYLVPPLLALIDVRNRMEKAAGIGLEIGKYNPGPLAECPHYVKIHCQFRRVHMMVAIGNIMTMACTAVHLYYLSNKLCML